MASVSKRRWTSPSGEKKEAWTVRYKDRGGSYKQRTFDRKKEADAYRVRIEGEMLTGVHVAGTAALTVDKLAKQYFSSRQAMARDGTLAPGTMAKDACYYERHILPHLGAAIVRDLEPAAIDTWLSSLRRTPANRANRLAPGTVKSVATIMARVIDYGVRLRFVGRNVVRDVMRWDEHRRNDRPKIRTFSPAEVQRIIATAEGRPPGMSIKGATVIRCAVYLAAFCGLRIGEVMGLRWEAIDFAEGVIRVRHSLDQYDTLRSTKTQAGLRDVPMPAVLAAELQRWRGMWKRNERDLLFRTKLGTQIKSPNFHARYWHPLLQAAQVAEFDERGRRFHFHALRHFCASMMIAGGIPMPDVASLLGHTSFDMTLQVYAHPIISLAKRHSAIEAMADQLRMPEPPRLCNDTHGALNH